MFFSDSPSSSTEFFKSNIMNTVKNLNTTLFNLMLQRIFTWITKIFKYNNNLVSIYQIYKKTF